MTPQQVTRPPKQKWATFTYVGKDTHFKTNISRHTDIQITFRTKNTMQNLLRPKKLNRNKFSSSGVYKLTCPECNKVYVGQTGRRFSLCHNKHRLPSTTIAHSPASHNTSLMKHTLSAPSMTSCTYCTTKRKAPTSTPWRNSTYIQST
jgi:hypothetical protein